MDITTMGERIKELRKGAGMTQEELGNKIGVSAQAVSKWECGSVPDTELIPKIADCFGVAIDALFGREYDNYDVYNLMSKHIIEAYEAGNGDEEVIRRALCNCWISFASSGAIGWPGEKDLEQTEENKEEQPEKEKDDKVNIGLMIAVSALCLGIIGVMIFWLIKYL